MGSEAYVVFDAPGEGGQGDLYAVSASGGTVFPVTFSRAHEFSPALSPDGVMLAYIRGATDADTAHYRVWIMNLLSGVERELGETAAAPARVAWSRDGRLVYVRTRQGDLVTPAPPMADQLEPARGSDSARADSAFQVVLGDPPFAVLSSCGAEATLCVRGDSGKVQVLHQTGRNPFQWGSDSLGYFVEDEIEVRPLGGGVTRRVPWVRAPAHPGTATYFGGLVQDHGPPGLH